MELRDLVLSTLEELDSRVKEEESLHKALQSEQNLSDRPESVDEKAPETGSREEEIAFLKHTKERLEVLFNGLHSSEIKEPEAKLEITLKYLQLLLSQVDERLRQIR